MKNKRRNDQVVQADRTLEEVRAIMTQNAADPTRATYQGLSTSEIAAYNRRLMFGANDEAFPSAQEWSRIVD
jgi:hypothetical protein